MSVILNRKRIEALVRGEFNIRHITEGFDLSKTREGFNWWLEVSCTHRKTHTLPEHIHTRLVEMLLTGE